MELASLRRVFDDLVQQINLEKKEKPSIVSAELG